MLERITDWIGRRPRARPFEALQIEVTSRCCIRCEMCPRTTLAERWPETDLSWQAFTRIARAFPRVRHVHLQGWGEPLLHPRLLDMVALAKSAGCRVGLTTNGMGLHRDMGRQLLDLRLDLLSTSIAGATRETHERIRVSTDFSAILENVSHLARLRAEQGRTTPKIEISYLMTKASLGELPEAVELARSLGADELYAINLDYLVTAAHDELRAFGCSPLRDEFVRLVEAARARARAIGLSFRAYPLDLEEVAVCEAHPTAIQFVSCDGWASPCSYLALPGQVEIPRWFEGRQVTVPAMRFGNVQEQELTDIWDSPAWREFRRQFSERRMHLATRALAALSGGGDSDPRMPPPPEPCRTCYKLLGV